MAVVKLCFIALPLVLIMALFARSASAEVICVGEVRQCDALGSRGVEEPSSYTPKAAPWISPYTSPYYYFGVMYGEIVGSYEAIDAKIGDVLLFVYTSNHNVALMSSESRRVRFILQYKCLRI